MFFSGFGTDDENELPSSTDWFKLDGDVGLGRANKRADLVKVEGLLANSGDLDLSEIGGPTGYGLYAVEDGVKKYQTRNGLEVDGWMRPGGPTITKMKEQLGGLLSGYPAPTPEQVDQHHRLRAEGKDGLLNVELPPISLKGNPYLPPVDKSTHGSNESLVNWMTRHQKGLGGAPDMLATYIKNFGTDGIVQARDFVEQWDKAVPGEGETAIRAILSLLSDPAQQRAFLGGELPQGTPFGVLKPDPAEMIDYVMAPERWTRNNSDNAPRWVYDVETGNAGWVVPKKLELLSSNEATDQAQTENTDRDVRQVGAGVQVAQNSGTMSDAESAGGANEVASAEAQEARARNEAHHDRFFEKYAPIAEKLGEELGVPKEWILALISRENGWEKDGPNPQNNPFGMMTPSGKKQYESLDAAVEDWKKTWGPRVKDSVDFEDFIKGLQTRGRWPYNSAESETNPDRKGGRPPYEQMLRDQYRSIQNRFPEWQEKRKPTL